jgi:hypothetical protein
MSGLKCLIAAIAIAGAVPAHAQEINPLVRERMLVTADNRGQQVRVQTNVSLFMPGPSGDSDAAVQLRDKARRAIYEMAARECGLVEDILAKTCRLEAINVNINRQVGQVGTGMGEGYMVGGNITMMITLK